MFLEIRAGSLVKKQTTDDPAGAGGGVGRYIIIQGGLDMTVKDVQEILGARVLTGEEFLDREVRSACGSDMMSDVLAFSKDHSVLLTGLCNPQVIRTAEMLDIVCLVFVRGKKPDETIIEMAKEREIIVLETGHRMFSSCGMLYKAGLGGGAI